jgi:hypothetical protein
MNDQIKKAMDAGAEKAKVEVKEKLRTELEKRRAAVGWKEHPNTPGRLSDAQK